MDLLKYTYLWSVSRAAILRRLDRVIAYYGEADEANEMEFSVDVNAIISQIERFTYTIKYGTFSIYRRKRNTAGK